MGSQKGLSESGVGIPNWSPPACIESITKKSSNKLAIADHGRCRKMTMGPRRPVQGSELSYQPVSIDGEAEWEGSCDLQGFSGTSHARQSLPSSTSSSLSPCCDSGTIMAFGALGVLNNMPYVIMLAAAKSISEGGTALVYLANVVPGLIVKISAPYWFDRVSYRRRLWTASLLMGTAFVLVGLCSQESIDESSSQTVSSRTYGQLLGVALMSVQCGLGEASLLALAGGMDAAALTAFSSGTGVAGPAGYLWKIVLTSSLGWSLRRIAYTAILLPILYAGIYQRCIEPILRGDAGDVVPEYDTSQLEGPSIRDRRPETDVPLVPGETTGLGEELQVVDRSRSTCDNDTSREDCTNGSDASQDPLFTVPIASMTGTQRFHRVLSLWRYIVPLFTVYAAEYVCQAGVWTALGFPVSNAASRNHAYQTANACYQTGVLVSRSSGNCFRLSLVWLWILPGLQIVNLVFFTYVAANAPDADTEGGRWFWYYTPTVLYGAAVGTGLLGGGVYIHGYQRVVADSTQKDHCEFALSSVSVAEGLGVGFADILSLWWQSCLYKANNLAGAVVSCPF